MRQVGPRQLPGPLRWIGPLRRRAEMAELAERAGIGPVRRRYRTRRTMASRGLGWLVFGGALAAATVYVNLSATFGYVIAATVIGLFLYLVYRLDTGDPAGWYHIGAADGGLVLIPKYGTPTVLPWASIAGVVEHRAGTESVFEVQAVDAAAGGGRPMFVRIDAMTGRGALIRSILDRTPVRPPVVARAVVAGVLAVVLLVTAWLVFLPDFIVRSEKLPGDVDGLARACERAGAKFPDAPRLAGPAPHPIRAFAEVDDQNGREYGPMSVAVKDPPPGYGVTSPREIQLVACVRRTGSGATLDNCVYREQLGSDVKTLTMRSATYTVDVYELRSHRRVGSVRVTGDDGDCPTYVGDDDELYSELDPDDLRAALDPYVNR
ncbi:hypothetical protein [Virgisporangium aurantiacum]|uniref:Uncharacterized protein n=1 Tax=Virgisporangium aurantiacum TaxID=175570 RepID=A0A8J4DZI6_9ACTN|nr:hypothetical protein [Virgisporangium aurantiacum]GIJ56770.1 hypothetical protein Vau01_042860 [Virgisporangium aurantiacum]